MFSIFISCSCCYSVNCSILDDPSNVCMKSRLVLSIFISCSCCYSVNCPILDDPSNGTVSCLLSNNVIPSYEDTCNYTCDDGFKLFGSEQSICSADGTWSGGDVVCDTGIYSVLLIGVIDI